MKIKLPARAIGYPTGFVLFALAYYAPHLMEARGFRAPAQFASVLTVPAVQLELLRNFVTHLLLLALVYAAVVWVAMRLASAWGLRRGVSCMLFLTAAWLLMLTGNRLLFPLSDYSLPFEAISRPGVAAVAGLVLLAGGLVALFQVFRVRHLAAGAALAGIVGVFVGAGHGQWARDTHAAGPQARNVIIVGIDSLSGHMARTARDELPNLTALLDEATVFERAYTPLGRTFPAWVTLLSGRAPAEHGALFNLRSMEHVTRDTLVTRTLGEAGYRRVFAIDDRRFSNIDESFGFDHVVGPKAGVLDFALQAFNDTPLTNLLLQTRLARYLLPFSYLNVASYANYDARGFVDETLAAITGTEPLFFAVHFESAHYPFKTRHAARRFAYANRFLASHLSALTTVDAQVGRLMAGLRDSGRLDDALVIVLSDHGESLGEVEASTTRTGKPLDVMAYGHGANVLNEHQNRIVLGLVQFKKGRAVGPATVRDDQVSLRDLRAVMERYARSGEVALYPGGGCMTVETGIRFLTASNYNGLDVAKVAEEGAGSYAVDAVGRMHLRESHLPELVASKDVGWRCHDRLTYYSSHDDRYFAYRLMDGGRRLIEAEPRADDIARIDDYRTRLRKAVGG